MSFQVSYTVYMSPVGEILLASTDRGICMLTFGVDELELRHQLEKKLGSRVLKDSTPFLRYMEELDRYFQGEPVQFKGPFDLRGTSFQMEVWKALQRIPYGHVKSYGEVAKEIGRPLAYRAVGNACGSNPIALMIPCHRVIASGNRLGGYGLGLDLKKKLLEFEGYPVSRLLPNRQ